jgi:hypothetical protein
MLQLWKTRTAIGVLFVVFVVVDVGGAPLLPAVSVESATTNEPVF